MKIYLCARYGRKQELLGYAAEANRAGCHVVSRWLYADEATDCTDPAELHRWATRDRDEVWQADALVFFAEPDPFVLGCGRGGRNVEWGIAVAYRKQLVLIGAPENCFHALAHKTFATWAEALAYLRPKHEHETPGFFRDVDAHLLDAES